jgi:tetratricopeptide (TPR) repeat protein
LGLISKIQGKEKEAKDYYQYCIELSNKLLEDDPENPYVYSTLGLAYTALGEHKKGLQQAEHAVSLDPENGEILYDLARIYALQNEPDKAIQTLEKALDKCLSPSEIEAKLDPHFKCLQEHSSFLKVVEK